jgi:two-component system alkaline phosphatase synthesis response regulator PhoP
LGHIGGKIVLKILFCAKYRQFTLTTKFNKINFINCMANQQKIIIIEDEKTLLDAIAKKLEVENYQVQTALDGQEGLEKIKEDKPDLILLDILMPKVDGFEVLEKLNKDPGLSKIPVIIISNSGQPVEIERAMSLGVKDYLIKAEFDPQEVIVKVKNVLGQFLKKDDEKTKKAGDAKNILIIEDDQLLRSLCSKKLMMEGFNVDTAIDSQQGLEKINKNKPDLVLLDLVLPGMSGFEVLKIVKSNPDKKIVSIPVIILSNLGQESDIKKGKELGAEDYLIKATTTTDEIVDKIKSVLSK